MLSQSQHLPGTVLDKDHSLKSTTRFLLGLLALCLCLNEGCKFCCVQELFLKPLKEFICENSR